MRRVVVGSLVLCVAGAVPALAAPGDKHSQSTVAVHQAFWATDISLDAGNVLVRRGATPSVEITKTWSGQEPTVTVKVSGGVLHVDGQCAPFLSTPVVTVYAPSTCTTSIVLTVPTDSVDSTVNTYGNVVLSDLGGRQVLHSGSGDLAVSRTNGGSLKLDTNGGSITLTGLRGTTLQANSGSGTVQLTDGTLSGDASLSTNGGDVTARDMSARNLSLSTGSGSLGLQRVNLRGAADLHTNGGNVALTSVRADRVTTSSGSGLLTASDLVVTAPLSFDTNGGDVALTEVRAPSATLNTGSGRVGLASSVIGKVTAHTNGGDVNITGSRSHDLNLTTGSGTVTLVATTAPQTVVADTNGGNVNITVPRGAYGLTIRQNGGQLTLDGITPDKRSGRTLDLSTGSGDISVQGR